MHETESYTDLEGVEIVYRHWQTDGTARGSVVIAHGASEHSGRYARFAQALNQAGFEVFAPDHRGHGLTSTHTGVGIAGPGGAAATVTDLGRMVDIAAGAASPVILFGHSLGSIIALRAAEQRSDAVIGLALTGPLGAIAGGVEMRAQLEQAVDAGMADQPVDALGAYNAQFEPARTPFDWLSRDETEVDKYLADRFCGDNHPLTYGYLYGMIGEAIDSVADAGSLPAAFPVLLAAGERDPASNNTQAVRDLAAALREAGLTDISEIYYPDARHEILNETNRDEVTTDLLDWMMRVTNPAE